MNKMLARGEEEVAAFEEVDCRLEEGELSAWVALRKGANKEAYARLASDEEVRPLLHAAVAALVPKNEDEGKDFGKGKRARADVRYHEK